MMTKLKPWLILGMIFVAGIMTGVALTVALSSHFMRPPGMQQMKSGWMMHLTRKLDLTADQQAKIEPILTASESQIQKARRDNAEAVALIIKDANTQIAAILTPEQKVALEKMSKEMEQNRDRMFPGGRRQWGGPRGDSDGGQRQWRHDGPPSAGAPPPPVVPPNDKASK